MTVVSTSLFGFASDHPIAYLALDFLALLLLGLLVLFMKDINEWIEARRAASRQAQSQMLSLIHI